MREREGENDDTINYIRKNDEKHKKNEVIMRWKKSSCMNIINQKTNPHIREKNIDQSSELSPEGCISDQSILKY